MTRERFLAADLLKSPNKQLSLYLVIDDPLLAASPQDFDVTMASQHYAPYRNLAEHGASTLDQVAKKKVEHNSPLCQREVIELVPFAIDVNGQISGNGLSALHDLSNFMANRRGSSLARDSMPYGHVSQPSLSATRQPG